MVGKIFHIIERETAFHLVLIQVQHSKLVGIFIRNLVYDIKTKVERFFVLERNALQCARFVLHRIHKFFADEFFGIFRRYNRLRYNFFFGILACKYHCQKFAIASADRYHAVRRGAVVINAVAFFQNLRMVADLHL